MAEETQPQPNPFWQGLKEYGASLPGRVLQLPVKAVQLPIHLAQEALETRGAQRGARTEAAQRDLYTRVTGQDPDYSESRRWANAFSLGLVPNNQAPTVNPEQLPPDQADRFKNLTPLEQRLLQAKNPRDFANLLGEDGLFHEPEKPPVKAQFAPAGSGVIVNGEMVDQVPFKEASPQVVPPGSAVTVGGEQLYRNEYAEPSVVGKNKAAARASGASADLSMQKIEESKAKIKDLDEKADAEAPPSIKDRSAVQAMEKRSADQVLKRVKDLDRGLTAARNFHQLYELRDAKSMPKDQLRVLTDMGFKDLGNRDPRSVQDLMLMTLGVRASDPPGRITDKDVDMYSRARVMFDPGIVEAVAKGQVLTNAQRNEMAIAMHKLTAGMLQSSDMAVIDGRKTALRDRITAGGGGSAAMNPMNIPDPAADLRQMMFGQELGDQAAYPLADQETESLLEQLWDLTHMNQAPTAQDLVDFANAHGFRIDEMGE